MSDKKLPSKLETLLQTIESMSVIEIVDLVKAMEERFGVSAAAPIAPSNQSISTETEEVQEEQTAFAVVLTDAGSNKISAIKVVRAITQLGLKEAKDAVESVPYTVKENIKKDEAETLKKQIEDAGAKAELK